MEYINQMHDSEQEKNLREQQKKVKESQESSLPDGIEEINGRLIDRKSGGEYLRMNPEALKVAVENMMSSTKLDKWKPRPYDAQLDDYFQSLNMQKERRELSFQEAKKDFFALWWNRIRRKPLVALEDIYIVKNFIKWLILDKTSEFDLNKGILMCGTQGCGKTELMKTGAQFCSIFETRSFKFKRIGDIFLELNREKNISAIDNYLKGDWCFDDIGQMNEDVVLFSKFNIVETLINHRVGRENLTLGTSNLLAGEFRGKYGDIVGSRLNQMFTIVEFKTNEDYRKL